MIFFTTLIAIIVFFFGAIIGSFLNVVILRYRSGRGLGGRSMCFSCGKQLHWSELVPIGSFLSQKGKCTVCYAPISWQYPIVEILTGALFVFLYQHFAYLLPFNPLLFSILFAFFAFVFCLLIVLSVYDLKFSVLPDPLTYLFCAVSFIGMFLIQGDAIIIHLPDIWRILSGILLAIPFASIWFFSKGRWMGLGDAKLMMGIGFLLGISSGAAAILLAFWIGALISLGMIAVSRITASFKISIKTAIPFGPFLAASTVVVYLSGINLMSILRAFRFLS